MPAAFGTVTVEQVGREQQTDVVLAVTCSTPLIRNFNIKTAQCKQSLVVGDIAEQTWAQLNKWFNNRLRSFASGHTYN